MESMKYLNTVTLKQSKTYLDTNSIVSTDPRVSNWFANVPQGHKGEWVGDTYTFIEIPAINIDGTVNSEGFGVDELETKESGELHKYYNQDGTPDAPREDLEVAEYEASQYSRDREVEYAKLNQDEMRFDDVINGTTVWVDTIKSIKAMYPK